MPRLSTVSQSLELVLALLALGSVCTPALGAAPQFGAPSLRPGDPAPQLSIAEWVKGDPVKSFEKGRVYVVEFWATWCGPCIVGMPHLTEVQKEWGPKGLTIISVSSEDPRGNSLDRVKAMVTQKGDVMGYTVAWDQGRTTNDAWMRAAGRGGIPCCFVVDQKGMLAWVGHPMWLDDVVGRVIAGEWSVAKDVARLQKGEAELNDVLTSLGSDPKAALGKLEAFAAGFPKVAETYGALRFQLLIDARRFKDAGALGKDLVDEAIEKEDARDLNMIAWTIVDPRRDIGDRGLSLALKAALAANRITDGENPALLHTLARVHFKKGDLEKAIKVQKRALEKAKSAREKQILATALEEYEAAGKGADEG